jgi:hypothetical protein
MVTVSAADLICWQAALFAGVGIVDLGVVLAVLLKLQTPGR